MTECFIGLCNYWNKFQIRKASKNPPIVHSQERTEAGSGIDLKELADSNVIVIVRMKNVSDGLSQHCCKSPVVSYLIISETSRNCHVGAVFRYYKHIFPIFPGTLSSFITLSFLPPWVLSHKHTESLYHKSSGKKSILFRKVGKKPLIK